MSPQRDDTWFSIDGVERLPPFMVSVVSDDDHWLFFTSNGGVTAGRGTPERALFPYRTQDQLIDLARHTGSLTLVRDPGGTRWRPLDPTRSDRPRTMAKRIDGTGLRFTETAADLGLTFSEEWGFSRRFGFVRRCRLHNRGDRPRTVAILDGLQQLAAPGVSDDFAARFGNLVDAYRRTERLADTDLRLTYLNSVPTDRAEPSESLRCNVVWTVGIEEATPLLRLRQVARFEAGGDVAAEEEARGERAASLDCWQVTLSPGQATTWTTVADVDRSTADVTHLQRFLQTHDDDARAAVLDEELAATRAGLRAMVARADGLQHSRDPRRQHRHLSNVMFNIMRGGIFLPDGRVHRDVVAEHVAHFDRACAARHAAWLAALPETVVLPDLVDDAAALDDPALTRLLRQLLPLTFSRRHGDPSRPWNRFAIDVRDRQGRPRLAWQGNWRDIFQNWEALAHSAPAFLEGMISLFLSASTVDGHNPYRITDRGIDWEVPDPDEPWSNIGYWGDHQLVYLLRLLEASRRFHPGRLDALLGSTAFTYADVPYRLAPYADIVADPRDTIAFDEAAAARVAARVAERGADGRLLPGPDGSPLQVGLLEKLLVPLLSKLSSFVPGGGIWMNTQRPEWNDANNALVGFGVSVVTLAYAHRFLSFLLDWLGDLPPDAAVPVSHEVVTLLRQQAEVFGRGALVDDACRDPMLCREVMDRLGEDASRWRQQRYADGLSGQRQELVVHELRAFLDDARRAVARTLRANQRPDGLFHSYNLLRFEPGGGVHLDRLPEMLEGQVAVLSAGLLSPRESLAVLAALRESALYRPDQDSYMLYPDRDPPRFLDKNRIPPDVVADSALLQALAAAPHQRVVERDADGGLCFAGSLRNGAELREALAALPPRFGPLVRDEGEALVATLGEMFDHRAFTGRSGTFFAYEGLGSIYWHMVSKLVLAAQEQVLAAADTGADEETVAGLAAAFAAALEGLGLHKSAEHYGAFPTDAYSHTPRHAGAQQPGMTGQVKEDILVRWGELGVQIVDGRLGFRPRLLRQSELAAAPTPWSCLGLDATPVDLTVPAGGMAFTFCQVPVVYRAVDGAPELRVVDKAGGVTTHPGHRLPADTSAAVFDRTGAVARIEVDFPRADLLLDP